MLKLSSISEFLGLYRIFLLLENSVWSIVNYISLMKSNHVILLLDHNIKKYLFLKFIDNFRPDYIVSRGNLSKIIFRKKFRLLENPVALDKICLTMSETFKDQKIDLENISQCSRINFFTYTSISEKKLLQILEIYFKFYR